MKNIMTSLTATTLLFASSCYNVPCSTPLMSFLFYGFDSSELKPVIINKYQKDGSFSNLAASDTLFSQNGVNPNPSIDPTFDYTVVIPATGRTYKLKNISFGNQTTKNNDSKGCTKSASWDLDNVPDKYSGWYYYNEATSIIIKK